MASWKQEAFFFFEEYAVACSRRLGRTLQDITSSRPGPALCPEQKSIEKLFIANLDFLRYSNVIG